MKILEIHDGHTATAALLEDFYLDNSFSEEDIRKALEKYQGKVHAKKIRNINTSFNIHGEPIVCTPEDALSTLTRSRLKHLIIGDYYVTKQPAASGV